MPKYKKKSFRLKTKNNNAPQHMTTEKTVTHHNVQIYNVTRTTYSNKTVTHLIAGNMHVLCCNKGNKYPIKINGCAISDP